MNTLLSQKQKAINFHRLHHSKQLLILPNVWNPLSALLLEDCEYEAVATASAAMSFIDGIPDHEVVSFNDLVHSLKKIVNSVSIPVSADIESGYADNLDQLRENIERLLEIGIVGINIEDTNHTKQQLISIEEQCERIRLIKKITLEKDIPLFINARIDTYIHNSNQQPEEKLQETIKRGLAYKEAGADGLYPIVMREYQHIKDFVEKVKIPVNILTLPGIPELEDLLKIGVSRVSLGPSFLKIALKEMKRLALKLQKLEGLTEIKENEITSDYIQQLISKFKDS